MPRMVDHQGLPAASPKGSQRIPLAGLIQAGFEHRLLERSPDVLAYADALRVLAPDDIFYRINEK